MKKILEMGFSRMSNFVASQLVLICLFTLLSSIGEIRG